MAERVIQIKNLDPEVMMLLDTYEVQHPVKGKRMSHAELLTRAMQALIASETANV